MYECFSKEKIEKREEGGGAEENVPQMISNKLNLTQQLTEEYVPTHKIHAQDLQHNSRTQDVEKLCGCVHLSRVLWRTGFCTGDILECTRPMYAKRGCGWVVGQK